MEHPFEHALVEHVLACQLTEIAELVGETIAATVEVDRLYLATASGKWICLNSGSGDAQESSLYVLFGNIDRHDMRYVCHLGIISQDELAEWEACLARFEADKLSTHSQTQAASEIQALNDLMAKHPAVVESWVKSHAADQ